jgi:DNA-binding XRE family transcriptional regulator
MQKAPQFITSPKGERMVVLSQHEYEKLIKGANSESDEDELIEMEAELARYRTGKIRGIPSDVVFAKLNGISRLCAWRTHRKLTVEELAVRSGVSRAYITQIENGSRTGTVKTLRKIADALQITLNELAEVEG